MFLIYVHDIMRGSKNNLFKNHEKYLASWMEEERSTTKKIAILSHTLVSFPLFPWRLRRVGGGGNGSRSISAATEGARLAKGMSRQQQDPLDVNTSFGDKK